MEGTFYNFQNKLNSFRNINENPGYVFVSSFLLTEVSYSFSRRIYGWFDLLGDLGGVTDVFVLIFTYFFAPISEFNFILEASKKLFMARTKTDDLFQ